MVAVTFSIVPDRHDLKRESAHRPLRSCAGFGLLQSLVERRLHRGPATDHDHGRRDHAHETRWAAIPYDVHAAAGRLAGRNMRLDEAARFTEVALQHLPTHDPGLRPVVSLAGPNLGRLVALADLGG